jgi:hypothetical protein
LLIAPRVPKQALLILVRYLAYEEDATARENVFIDISQKVFGYSHASDRAQSAFIESGYSQFVSDGWQSVIEEHRRENEKFRQSMTSTNE